MPRVARISTKEGIFHIMCRGNNGQWVFKDEKDFRYYKEILIKLKEEQPFKLYHYCLMNNHVHLIMGTSENTGLSRLIKRLNLKYYHYYKIKYGYSGHFWQGRFKSLLIEGDRYLLGCGLYIERNPVRAKIVKRPEQYKYSSYKYYANGENDSITDRDVYYEELGKDEHSRQREYGKLMIDDELGITDKTFSQIYMGSDDFVKEMEKKHEVKNVRMKRGRPRKGE